MLKRVIMLLTALLLACTLAAAGQEQTHENVLNGILEFKAAQSGAKNVSDWAKSVLPGTMGQGGEWYAIALSQQGGQDLSACRTALDNYLAETKVRSAATRQKLALTLLALGDRENAFVAATLEDSIGKQGVMSWAWGLQLLNNGCVSGTYSSDEVVDTLLSLRKEDGGWAVTGGVADVDATCMVIQALAPHRERADVAATVQEGVALLAEHWQTDGAFSSYGVKNAESCAQVIIALCAADVDPFADVRFIRNGENLLDALCVFRLADGSFVHEQGGTYSESATVQACLALSAYQRYRAGEGSVFLLDGAAAPGEMKTAWGYKPIAAAIIGTAALGCCIVLLVRGKRHPKNFLAVAVIAGLLMAAVYVIDVQSADSYYSATLIKKEPVGSVTLTIRCDKVAGRAAHIPPDGVILPPTQMPIAAGDTVYAVLTDAARKHGIHMEGSGAQGLMYIHGIANIYEFDYGDLSGWVYLVNGASASVGCDQHQLRDGDRVEFHYTLELGKDIE